jgi:predicted ATP-grasp superfamily ATP-dependent carboligase
MHPHILVAGFSTRHVVQSAHRAGCITYAVDHFCDQDLFWYTRDRRRFEELEEIPAAVQAMCEQYPIDFLVVTSGAEHLTTRIPILGSSPSVLERLLDKLGSQRFFETHDIPTPRLVEDGNYPAMVKPRKGAGGWRNREVRTPQEMTSWKEEFPECSPLIQEIVCGIPASVSCIADGTRAVAIAVNEQMLQGRPDAPYGFAGSITPIEHPLVPEMIAIAERTAVASKCIGTLGIDFILGDQAWAIEVNPRFQATLDTVERSTGQNLFSLHREAFQGRLPERRPSFRRFTAREILFAERTFLLEEDLSSFAPQVADIPWPGTEFEEGNAIISVFGQGNTRDEALETLNINITRIRRYIQQ